jgi:hypothetical protein
MTSQATVAALEEMLLNLQEQIASHGFTLVHDGPRRWEAQRDNVSIMARSPERLLERVERKAEALGSGRGVAGHVPPGRRLGNTASGPPGVTLTGPRTQEEQDERTKP